MNHFTKTQRTNLSKATRSSAFLISAFGLLLAPMTKAAPPPDSPREIVTDDYFGKKIPDPYRWLEGGILIENQELAAQIDERVSKWTDKQNAYTRSVLDNLPGRSSLEERIAKLIKVDSIGTPAMYGTKYFFTKRTGDQNQSVLFVKDKFDAEPRALLDPNTLDEDGLRSLAWRAPSPDGSLMAFGLDYAGKELPTLYVMNVNTGAWLADEIPSDAGSVSWLPDSSGFLYSVRADINDAYSSRIKFHKLGNHYSQDHVLIKQHGTTWGPYAYFSRDARWIIVGDWTGTDKNDLWVVDADQWRRTGEFIKTPIAVGLDATFEGAIYGDTLYMRTSLNAQNGIVYAVDLNHPQQDNWKTVIPQRNDATLTGVSIARGMLITQYLYKAHTQLMRFDLQGNSLGEVDLPGIGSARLSTDDDRTEAFLAYSSFNEPPSIYHIDLADNSRELWARPEIPVDPSSVVVQQVENSSKDGTPITMFIVHKKGIKLDGSNPTILNGYGGFNISMTPYFSPTMFTWYEDGGVYALPNLRGGGEYGEAWHKAGMLENKQNVFDDFIAAAQYLIENGYTNPKKLAITGGSNGGLLTGAVAVQRPDLFSAVVVAVPLLDMLRYQKFLMARYWVPEYGSSENEDQFNFLIKYSPYQNIKEGVEYPAIFLTAGENDARVHASHARKMAAALQYATASDRDKKPILLWVDRVAGHGSGKPIKNIIRDIVDQRIFLRWQLGMIEQSN